MSIKVNVSILGLLAMSTFGILPSVANSQTSNVVFWNKLGSADEIGLSEIGPGLTQLSYKIRDWQEAKIAPAEFGNGLFINHDIGEGWRNDGANFFALDLAQVDVTPQRGTIEFWFKFEYGAETHNHAYFFDTRNALQSHYPNQNWNDQVALAAGWNGWDYGSYGKRFFFCIGKGSPVCIYTPDFSAAPGGGLAFSAGTTMHFAFVWDASGIAGSRDKIRVYVNGEPWGASQSSWNTAASFTRYLFIGSGPNCCQWDTAYNAVKGVTDNLVIRNQAHTDFSGRFDENPGIACDSVAPQLSARISKKTGPKSDRLWEVSLHNPSYCQAINAQIDDLLFKQISGNACFPNVVSPDMPLGVGDIGAGGSASGEVTVDFSSCPNNARFSVTVPFSNNDGASTGVKTFNNQYR